WFHPKRNELGRRLHALKHVKPVAVSAIWRDLGRRAFEALRLNRTSQFVTIDDAVLSKLVALDDRPGGTLVLLPHLGHWEAMGVALVRSGFVFSAVSTLGKNDLINRWIQEQRARVGLRVIDTPNAARRIVRELLDGGNIALFMDVPSKRAGHVVRFLGREVRRSTIAGRLGTLTGCSCVFVYNLRANDGRYHVHVEEIPDDADAIKWSHDRLETLISNHAEQWVWLLE
ncbi:MAG: lysophospholipid acyltransferase family protein, partial [Bradymonadia bacterium]